MSVKGVQFIDRDYEIFTALQRFGFLSIPMLCQVISGKANKSAMNRRLKKLVDYKLIKRTVPLGSSQYFYYATENIREFLGNDRPLKRYYSAHLLHDTQLAQVMLHLYMSYPEEKIYTETEMAFLGSYLFKTQKEHKGKIHRLNLHFLPDGAINFQGKALYFFEYDRSTEWGLKLHQKIFAYEEYFHSEGFKRDFGKHLKRFRVLMLCKGQPRIDGIQETYAHEEMLSLFVFTTHQEFLAHKKPLHAKIWKHTERKGKFALGK